MRKMPWHYILALGNVALAGTLLYMGSRQRTEYFADKLTVTDYISPATQVAYMINFPAVIVWGLIRHLLPDQMPAQDTGFLLLVGILWYLIGLRAFHRTTWESLTRRGRVRVVLMWACAIGGIVALWLAAVGCLVGLHPALGFGGALWCICLTWCVGVAARRKAGKGASLGSNAGQ